MMGPPKLFTAYRIVVMLVLTACSFSCYQPITVPIETIRYDAADVKGPRLLVVFLPGNGDPISVFQKKSLIEAVRRRGLPVDMIAVNAHVGYYIKGTIFTRLKEDVIEPAKARGYKQIWLAGNSLGGYGSISYAQEHPDDIAGVILLGPFLGERSVIKEIREAGGVSRWEPGTPEKKDWERRLWFQLKDCEAQKKCLLSIYLGYGRDDRFAYAQDFMASLLPSEQVVVIEGGHDWSTWETLWNRFLDQNIFGL
jgi:hypothetical protein